MSYLKEKDERLIYELNSNIKFIDKALITFKQSIEKCRNIGIKSDYSYDELESFEALTARLARVTDILTQKVFVSFFKLIGEDLLSFIDRANFAEKVGIVDSADDLIEIRKLRNTIAHEYVAENLIAIFKDALLYSNKILSIIDKTKDYIHSKIEI